MVTYSPAELGLLLLDPHRDLEAFGRSAHLLARVAHDRGEIERAVSWAASELADRRARNQRDGRRLVVACDEAPAALADERLLVVATETARQSRKFGISFVVGSQDSKRSALGELPGVLLNRWIGLCADARASAQLSGHAGLNAHLLTGKGDFLHVVGARAERLQVALATEADLAKIPRAVDVPELPEADLEALLPDLLEDGRGPGRPAIEAEPELVAFYLHNLFAGAEVSVRQAAARGITRTRHSVNSDFADAVHRYLDAYDQRGEDLEDDRA